MPYRNRTYYPLEIDTALYRSIRQILKAARQGDPAAAAKWVEMLERQLLCEARIDGLLRRTHRPRPLTSLPPKPAPKTQTRQGVEMNPITPEHERAVAVENKRRWRAHLEKLGVKPRGDGA